MIQDITNHFYDIYIDISTINNIRKYIITPSELIQKCFNFNNYKDLINFIKINYNIN